jgi:hypothetical protein
MRHGGQLPTVRAAAARRYAGLLGASVDEIERALAPYELKRLRYRAAKHVLRLSGITAGSLAEKPDTAQVEQAMAALLNSAKTTSEPPK